MDLFLKKWKKYLNFAFTDENKDVLEKYAKLCDKIKYHSQTINC